MNRQEQWISGGSIQKFREKRSMTREEFARALTKGGWPVSASRVADMEEGRADADTLEFLAISRAMNVSVFEIVGIEFSPSDVERMRAEHGDSLVRLLRLAPKSK